MSDEAVQEDYEYAMYHKEKAPTGRVFKFSVHGPPSYWAKQGYVDNPAKHGLNLWGPDNEEFVKKIHHQWQSGRLKNLDDPNYITDEAQDEIDRLRAENEALKQLQAQPDIQTQMKRSEEEFNDEVSVAQTEMETRPEAQVAVDVNLGNGQVDNDPTEL